MTPNEVCADYSDRKVKITARAIENELVLLEGNREALEFLGNLFLAQAKDERSCHKSLTGWCGERVLYRYIESGYLHPSFALRA